MENFGRDVARLILVLIGSVVALAALACGLGIALWMKS